jgi:hypothetical protein
MTTDLSRMILAARQIGEVVGEDILNSPNYRTNDAGMMFIWAPNHSDYFRVPDDIALDVLTARVWRAMWAWSRGMKAKRITRNDLSGNVTQAEHGIGIHWRPQDVFGTGYPDLPSAVAAIHGWWRSQQPVEDKH